MTTPELPLTLENAQARIRADHERIRGMLERLEPLALAAKVGDGASAAPLTEAIWKLFLVFDEHLATEEAELAPLLVSAGIWGNIQVERMHTEHCQQRTVLLAMVDECDGRRRSAGEIAEDVRWLVDSLRNDMSHEEKQFEVARDDGFVVDQCTG